MHIQYQWQQEQQRQRQRHRLLLSAKLVRVVPVPLPYYIRTCNMLMFHANVELCAHFIPTHTHMDF